MSVNERLDPFHDTDSREARIQRALRQWMGNLLYDIDHERLDKVLRSHGLAIIKVSPEAAEMIPLRDWVANQKQKP